MPAKKGSKNIWISGEVHAMLREHIGTIPSKPSITRFVEQLIIDAAEGRPTNVERLTTDELIRLLFGQPEKMAELYASWKAGSLAYETLGKYLQALEPVQHQKKRK